MAEKSGNQFNRIMKIIERFGSLIFGIFFFWLVGTPLHEWFHERTTYLLGGSGHVTYSWLGGLMNFDIIPTHHLWLTYLSGGMGVFLIFIIFWFWAWKSPTVLDMYIELPAFLWAMIQFSYSFVELQLYYNNTGLYNLFYTAPNRLVNFPVIFGLILTILLYARKTWQWLENGERIKKTV